MHSLETAILDAWPVTQWEKHRLLIAVSGGPDSVACLRAFARLTPDSRRIAIAHFNHRWRGQASDDDAAFVRRLCESLNLQLVEGSASDPDQPRTEEAARSARYEFITLASRDFGARFVVTGHTADDRIETTVHNLFRGTGLAGLASPRQFREFQPGLLLVRPLVRVFRSQVLDYLHSLPQDFRTDSSNANDRYSRNFIRNQLLPLAREHYAAGIDRPILSLSELVEETLDAISLLGRSWLDEAEQQAQKIPVPIRRRIELVSPCIMHAPSCEKTPWPVIREGLKQLWIARAWPMQAMSRAHWQRVREALEVRSTDAGRLRNLVNLPGDIRLVALGDWRAIGQFARPVV